MVRLKFSLMLVASWNFRLMGDDDSPGLSPWMEIDIIWRIHENCSYRLFPRTKFTTTTLPHLQPAHWILSFQLFHFWNSKRPIHWCHDTMASSTILQIELHSWWLASHNSLLKTFRSRARKIVNVIISKVDNLRQRQQSLWLKINNFWLSLRYSTTSLSICTVPLLTNTH